MEEDRKAILFKPAIKYFCPMCKEELSYGQPKCANCNIEIFWSGAEQK